ncbi:MAG: hypothetical protein U0401_00540 [Anaerolineae bacterium]
MQVATMLVNARWIYYMQMNKQRSAGNLVLANFLDTAAFKEQACLCGQSAN